MSEPTSQQPKQKPEPEKASATPAASNDGSRMTDFDWGMLLGFAIFVDIIEFVIKMIADWIGLGIFIISLMNIFVGGLFAFVLWIKGVKFDQDKILMICATYVVKMIPLVGMLPAWSFYIARIIAAGKIKKVAGGNLTLSNAQSVAKSVVGHN